MKKIAADRNYKVARLGNLGGLLRGLSRIDEKKWNQYVDEIAKIITDCLDSSDSKASECIKKKIKDNKPGGEDLSISKSKKILLDQRIAGILNAREGGEKYRRANQQVAERLVIFILGEHNIVVKN